MRASAFLVCCASVWLGACEQQSPPTAQVRPVRAVTVEHRVISEPLVMVGQIKPQDEVNIAFRTGDAHLTSEDIDQLTTLGQLAGSLPGVKIQVSGHADPRGPEDYNKTLSQDRAESVAAVLENSGLKKDRIVIEALGASGASDTGNLDDYAFQRRVSVKLMGESSVAAAAQPAAVTVASAE